MPSGDFFDFFDIRVRHAGEDAVLVLIGELDIAAVPQLRAAVTEALAAEPAGLILDVSALSFVDAAGLRGLAFARAAAEAQSCRLSLVGPSPRLTRILMITRMIRIMPMCGSVAEAIAERLESAQPRSSTPMSRY